MTRRRGGALLCVPGDEGNEPSCDSETHNKSYEGGTKMMSLKGTYFKAMLGASVLLGAVAGLWLAAEEIKGCQDDDMVLNNLYHCKDRNGNRLCDVVAWECRRDGGRWLDAAAIDGYKCCDYGAHNCCMVTISKRVCKVGNTDNECWVRTPKDHSSGWAASCDPNTGQCPTGVGTP
jgi:hypothetical protein